MTDNQMVPRKPKDLIARINGMCCAAVDECKRREARFGYSLTRTREGYEDVRAYLVKLVEGSAE